MALFRTVSPGEATGKVKEVYEDIKETKGIDFILSLKTRSSGPGQR